MNRLSDLYKRYSILKLLKKVDDRYGVQAFVRVMNSHWFNPFATIYVNLLSFPFRKAVKLPIFIYGSPKIYTLVGDMDIIGSVSIGMISFNKTKKLMSGFQNFDSELSNVGSIIFHGPCSIGCGNRILVQKNATLEIGEKVIIADNVNIGCHQSISIGKQSRIAHRCQILESNHHFMLKVKDFTISPATHPIKIGKGCWICNSTTITGGVTIPDLCIVASNSLVNSSLGNEGFKADPGSIIGGIPARLIASKVAFRVFNHELEGFLFQWFAKHKDEKYILPEGMTIEEVTTIKMQDERKM